MAIVPAKLDGIVTHCLDADQLSVRHLDKSPLRTVPLTERARAPTAHIGFAVLADVAIVPGDAHRPAGFDVVDLGGEVRFHDKTCPLVGAGHADAIDQMAIHQKSPGWGIALIEKNRFRHRNETRARHQYFLDVGAGC